MNNLVRPTWPDSVRDSQLPFDEQDIETSVPARFARVARLCPDQMAIESWTVAPAASLAHW